MATSFSFFHADSAAAFGPRVAAFGRFSFSTASAALAKVAIADAAGSRLVLSADEANALIVALAIKATALRHVGSVKGPSLPVFPINMAALAVAKKDGAIVSPFDGAGAIGVDVEGPIVGRSDDFSQRAILALGGAVRLLSAGGEASSAPGLPSGDAAEKAAYSAGYTRGQGDAASGAPPIPPIGTVPAAQQGSYAAGYAAGYTSAAPVPVTPPGGGGDKLGVGPAVVIGGIVAGVALVGGAAYLIGAYREEAKGKAVEWKATEAVSVHAANKAADLEIERWKLEITSGKAIPPSPIVLAAAENIKAMAQKESGSRWGTFAIGAGLGVGGALAARYGARRLGVSV